MKQTLRALFLNYGEVLDVVAHRNLRMRGQAFVSFPNAEIAKKAQREVNRFPLYSKPMVSLRLFSIVFSLSILTMFVANFLCQGPLRCRGHETRPQ